MLCDEALAEAETGASSAPAERSAQIEARSGSGAASCLICTRY